MVLGHLTAKSLKACHKFEGPQSLHVTGTSSYHVCSMCRARPLHVQLQLALFAMLSGMPVLTGAGE